MTSCIDLTAWPDAIEPADLVLSVTYKGQPLPKERPRFSGKGWCYTGQRTRYYEGELRKMFLAARGAAAPDNRSEFELRCRFYRGDRLRCDVDNLVKCVADAGSRVIWADDSQITEVHSKLYKADDEPRVEVLVCRVRVE